MQLKKILSKNHQMLISKSGRWRHKLNSKGVAFLLVLLTVSFVLPFFSALSAQNVAQGEIEVNLTVSALLDKYGRPAVNEDDTFYPCDRFEITYSTKLARDIEFEGLDISYDRAIFNLFDNTDLVSQIGACSFEIMSLASAGTYTIHVTAYGSRTAGNETVTYAATATVTIQIVAYDPHFTLTLAYTIPSTDSSSCRSSFEQPFALILRYEGNGPDGNLRQRAVIDDYDWEGYAQKIPELDNMQQTLTPNLTVSSFLNQTSNTQFLRQGVDAKISQPALMVDGKSFANDELPLSFFWETNTNHTYTWTQALPVSEAEWFEWQASIVFPPQINPNTQQGNQSVSQEDLQNQLIEQINALNGNLTTTPFGNTVTAIYAHNKNIASLAKETSVDKNQTLNCLTDEPLYFTEQNRYAKLQYQLNPTVTKEITTQNFTSNLHYNLTVGCDLFGVPRYFEANFTCEYEFFSKQINATAYKWSPTLQNWTIDNTVAIDATFESALNITTTDILRSTLEEQTTDPTALQMATEDLYDSGIQRVTGTGSIETYLKRTSPLYYNLNVQAGNQQKVTLQKTIQINFQNNNTYNLPLNFNPNSPLQITTLSDSPQNTILNIDAPTELGGLTNITVYQITNLPNENWNTLQKNQLDLKWLKTLELTLPQEQVQMPPSHEQFYQYYQGYSAILEDILGFSGQTQIPIQKDQTTIALTSSSEALLYVEATNVWGTTFHQIITVQPYTTPSWNIPLNQATLYLITLITIAIIVSLITYYIKTIQK